MAMPSEQRLHPASIAFEFLKHLRTFALPGIVVLVTAGRSSDRVSSGGDSIPADWQLWLMLLLVPNAMVSIARYLSFRLRFDETELVIRSGLFFKNERHVPYARIQNLDGVQNVLHRLFGVVEVRAETGGGKAPEATISVLSLEAFHDMRRRVLDKRVEPAIAASAAPQGERSPAATDAGQTLLHLDTRELLLCGFIENRGLLLIATAYGLVWETGVLGDMWGEVFGGGAFGRGAVRDTIRGFVVWHGVPITQMAVAAAALAGLLLFVRLVSVAWAVTRLYGFRLTRAGNDLRTEFGLLTRVTATIPLRRVQTMTVREGPLHRLVGRASIRVETAGGGDTGTGTTEREWLAPLVHRAKLAELTREVLPAVDLGGLAWQPPHPRAFRRAVKRPLLAALVVVAAAALVNWWASLGVLAFAVPLSVFVTHRRLTHLGWAETEEVIAFRSGWIWRRCTVARVGKLQTVALYASPFDRRLDMARVRVDTAGAGQASHRIDIPYLASDVAAPLRIRLAARAARVEFSW